MAVRLLKSERFTDDRGWFVETYNQPRLAQLGIDVSFVQDSHSLSRQAGVLRGLHYQCPPHAQAKLVRCLRGRIWDVAVDIRQGSPTCGRWTAHNLSGEDDLQLFVPAGFAHGFLTLEPGSEVLYKASDVYVPECEGGLLWNDEDLAIPWPLAGKAPILSDRDANLPRFSALTSPFSIGDAPPAAT